jgi:hypothetical protein
MSMHDRDTEATPPCASAYTAWTGLTLTCTGDHLRGNLMRGNGVVHQQTYARIVWTWYDDEADA